MVGWLMGKLKWLLVVAAIGGPIIAVVGWQDGERTRRIAGAGIEAQAEITNAVRKKGRRGGTTYAIDLEWRDKDGKTRTAEEVSVSRAFADTIIRDNTLVVDRVLVKYDPGDTEKSGVIVAADAAEQESLDSVMTFAGAGGGIVGILGCAAIFGLGRRRRTEAPAAA